MLNEILKQEMQELGVTLHRVRFRGRMRFVTVGKTIFISSALQQPAEENAVFARALGHQHTCTANLLAAEPLERRKYEYLADRWATRKVMPLEKLVFAFQNGLRRTDEYCTFLEITPCFFSRGLSVYQNIYGQGTHCGGYSLEFDPFSICAL